MQREENMFRVPLCWMCVYTVKYIILINIIIYLLLLQDYNSLLKDFQCELMWLNRFNGNVASEIIWHNLCLLILKVYCKSSEWLDVNMY